LIAPDERIDVASLGSRRQIDGVGGQRIFGDRVFIVLAAAREPAGACAWGRAALRLADPMPIRRSSPRTTLRLR
jgi:hypothetical protein